MMNWYYGGARAGTGAAGTMIGWGGGYWIIALLFQIVILVDLILVGVWLWKHIGKMK